MRFKASIAALCILGCVVFGQSVGAQPPSPGVVRSHMGGPGHMPQMTGPIVGNKKSKIYHLPGEKGPMPAEKNRVYFRTEQEAIAAGYHAAKQKHAKPKVMPMHAPKMGGQSPPKP